jgi:hypothetical protein
MFLESKTKEGAGTTSAMVAAKLVCTITIIIL